MSNQNSFFLIKPISMEKFAQTQQDLCCNFIFSQLNIELFVGEFTVKKNSE